MNQGIIYRIESELIQKVFSAHSYRGALLSSAYNKGESLNNIFEAGDWTNADTFLSHYYAHASDTPVGQLAIPVCKSSYASII